MRVPVMDGSEVVVAKRKFDAQAMYHVPLRVGRRPPGGGAVAFPDWMNWQGKRRGKEKEKALKCASVVIDRVLAVGFDKTKCGEVTVYKNPEDIDKLIQAWRPRDPNMEFLFAGNWTVARLKELLELKRHLGGFVDEEEMAEIDPNEDLFDIISRGTVISRMPHFVEKEEDGEHHSSQAEIDVASEAESVDE